LQIRLANHEYTTYSPREYNFTTDGMDFHIEIEETELIELGKTLSNNDEFFAWIYDNYRTRSGFVSSMPYTKERFHEAINRGKDRERALSMYLMWVLETEFLNDFRDNNPYQSSLQEAVAANYTQSEFIDDERYHELSDLMI
jgi:hypothetical protein